ncbi:MAG: DNA polymerase III subunit epsilon [Gammaproteobacteria bacterium]|nr:MAG: DNA polymerase III subunit epsilon [Gammaproteobacteria bacterium]
MRQVVLDTETTGLEPAEGHRIIEIGCIELVNRRPSGRRLHYYLNPGREIDEGATEVHGIRLEDLQDKPTFADIAGELLEFIRDAELIIHNAPFDVGFIESELRRLDPDASPLAEICTITDTLAMARQRHPGQKNSLDALCKRYEVDNSQRSLHGALLDAEILADVYLRMTGGQAALFDEAAAEGSGSLQRGNRTLQGRPPALPVVAVSEADLEAHRRRLEAIDQASGGNCLWLKLPEC